MSEVAILIPCLDEALTIEKVITDFKRVLPSAVIYVCDNNSTDNTFEIAEKCGVNVLRELKKGKGNAVLKMFSEIEADMYVLVDGDDTYPADSVGQMLDLLNKKNASMVVGDRLSNLSYRKENKRKLHNAGNHLIKMLINVFFKCKLNDILSGYRVFDKAFVKNYSSLATGFELETDLSIFALHYDLPIAEIPVDYKDRPTGSDSKLNTFRDGYRVILTFVNLYRLYKPLAFFSLVSCCFLSLGLLLGSLPIYEFIKFGYVYRVPTAILASGVVVIALLMFCCGLILDSITMHDKKNTKMNIRNYASRSVCG